MPCSLTFFAERYGFPEAKIIFGKGIFCPFQSVIALLYRT